MNINELKELFKLVSKYNFSKFEMDFNGDLIRIERNKKYINNKNDEISVDKDIITEDEISFKSEIENGTNESMKIIKSPLVGVFYNIKKSDLKPYIQVGDKVKKGQVICLIESVKIMNEIKSEYDGVIENIYIPNKGIVEFGEPLVQIKLK